jgi:hypothetical protein
MKFKASSSNRSLIRSIARKVQSLKAKKYAKKERIIGPKQYRQQLKNQLLEHKDGIKDVERLDIASSRIKSLGLDKVSVTYIPQEPTLYDKLDKPIIKIGEIKIPEMEVILKDKIDLESMATIKFNNTKIQEHVPSRSRRTSKTMKIKLSNGKENIEKDKNENNYIIAIPSYNRSELIQVKTLALLNRHGIDPSNITIFVANKEQEEIYKKKVPSNLYGNIIVGKIGLKEQRNFIMDYYPEGKHIVQMDDDLEKIVELTTLTPRSRNTKTMGLKSLEDLDAFIKKAFEKCKAEDIYLWGVYPLANSRFMSPKVTTDLRFIVGPFWGIINRHRPDLLITIDEKENAERTLQHYTIDHKVLRFNNVGIETRYYKNKGGMQNEGKNRKEEALKSVLYLHDKYPKLTKIYLGKKSGVPEIHMIRDTKMNKTIKQ